MNKGTDSLISSKTPDEKAVQQFFTDNSADYAKLFLSRRTGRNFSFRERLSLAMEMTSGSSGRFIDCACGTGEITGAILSSGRFTDATVVDLSPRMLETTQQRLKTELKISETCGLEFVSSDIFAFDIQFRIGHYDLVLCLGLIAHTGRLDELLAKLKSLLSPGGRILLQSSLLDHCGNRIMRSFTEERYYRRHGYRISYFHHGDIVQSVQKAGLTLVDVRRFTFGFPFGDRLCAPLNYRLEELMKNWSRAHGGEALYLLQADPGAR